MRVQISVESKEDDPEGFRDDPMPPGRVRYHYGEVTPCFRTQNYFSLSPRENKILFTKERLFLKKIQSKNSVF